MNKTSDFFDNLEIFILDTAFKKEICNYEYCTDLFNELTIILKKIDCSKFPLRFECDISSNPCDIAKYYVKIANLIGTIFTTINPIDSDCDLFIKDFKYLYYDVYNYSNNKYDKISETNMIKYNEDLHIFNKYFSKNGVDIKKFSDINLINCNLEINNYMLSLKDDISSIVMMKYANSIINMINNINKYKEKLTEIFFRVVVVKNSKIFLIRNVKLRDLNSYINTTKEILIELYSKYSKDKKKMDDIIMMYNDIYNYKIRCRVK